MRIYIFCHWYDPNTTAPAFRAQSWVEGFSSLAQEVIVLTPQRKGNEPYPGEYHRKMELLEERKGNVRIFRLPLSYHPLRNTIARLEGGFLKRFLMGWYYLLNHSPVQHSFDLDFFDKESQIPPPTAEDWVLSSGPPFLLHRLALRWKMLYGCRWIADYRDLWTVGKDRFRWGWLKEQWQERIDGEWERHWMQFADEMVTVGPTLAADLSLQFPKTSVSILENGALEDLKQIPPPKAGGNRWLYVGNLYPAQKDIGRFFSLLDEAIRDDGLDFEWRFLGSNQYGCLNEWMEKFPQVAKRCKVFGWQSRLEVLEHYTWSNACLHFSYHEAVGIPSAKRNEYACSGRKVLYFADESKNELLEWAASTRFPVIQSELFRTTLMKNWLAAFQIRHKF